MTNASNSSVKPEPGRAHGTATDRGDIAESQATHAIFGSQTPISSLKSFFGHTLGACGAVEAWLGLEMMAEG